MANVSVSEYGKYVSLQNVSASGDPAEAPAGGVYLFASGAVGSASLYLQNEGGSALDIANLSVNIDSFSALGGTGVAQGDYFLFSDGGTEKKITFSNLEDAIFGNVSGDIAVAAGGAATIQANAVEGSMLNDNCISGIGGGELAQGSLAAADELLISDGGTLKKYGVDSLAKDAPALVSEAAMAVADDYVLFLDGGASGEAKKEQWSDIVSNIAGNGLAAASGVLAVGVDDSSIELNSDALRVKAQGITNAMLADDAVGADELAADAVVNASVAAGAAIAATKLDFNVDLGGNVTFGTQTDDTVTFTGHVNVGQQLTASHARITNLDVVTINSIAQTESILEIDDKLIISAVSASSANASGGGLKIGGGADETGHASLLWDHANSALDFNIGATTEMRLADGVLRPESDNDVDLGASGAEFKDLYLDGVAYIDSLQADQLGAALDANNQAITNVDINSGAIDGTAIGAAAQSTAKFTTVSGSGAATFASTVTAAGNFLPFDDNAVDLGSSSKEFKDLYLDGVAYIDDLRADALGAALNCASQAMTNVNIDSGDISAATISGGLTWSAAQDLNNVALTNVDVNSGAIDGTAIGANDHSTGKFTTMQATSHIIAGGNSIVDGGSNSSITFDGSGNTAVVNSMTVAGGYGSTGVTVSSAGNLQMNGDLTVDGGVSIGGGYSDGGSGLSVSSAGALQFNGAMTAGSDGEGADLSVHGGAANEKMMYDASENTLFIQNSSGATIVTLGGDASSEYAVDVANGSDNANKMRAAAFVTYSDESLKSDVASMSNTALDTVMSLNGVEFTWKDSGDRDFGFIAQEVQAVLPKAVHVAEDGVQGVDYSRLTSVLVEAVKAQQVQIEELKAILKK